MKYGPIIAGRMVSFVAMVVWILLSAPSPASAQDKTEEQRRSEAVQRELKRLLADERREQSRRDYESVVSRAQRAAEITDQLLIATQAYAQRTEALFRNDDGKRLAADSVSLVAFIDLLDHPVVIPEEVTARRAGLTSTLQLLKSQEDMVSEGHRPTDAVQDDVLQAYFWANETKTRFAVQQAKLDTLIAKAPALADAASAVLLDEAIRNQRTRLAQMSAQAQVAGRDMADSSVRQILVDATVLGELQRAQAEAARLIAEAKAQAECQKLDYETKIAELQKTIDSEHARLRIEEANRAAELERKEKGAAAVRYAENVDAKLQRDTTVSAADKKVLEQRCRDPKVKQMLAPFLSKGYLRPDGTNNATSLKGDYDTVEPVPISYKDLVELGATSRTGSGCDVLFSVGADPRDKMRTRWTRVHNWREDSKTRDMIPEAQKLLIELGPTLAELGMLQP